MIIGFIGYKQSGKTTASDYLVREHGFVRLGFKDGLIAEMKERLPETLEVLAAEYQMTVDELFVAKPPVVRALLQNYGTNVRRADDPDHWVNLWKSRSSEVGNHIVVDDVRFINEAQAIRDAGGVLVRVIKTDCTVAGTDKHISETEHLEIEEDFEIATTSGNMERLYGLVEGVVSELSVD